MKELNTPEVIEEPIVEVKPEPIIIEKIVEKIVEVEKKNPERRYISLEVKEISALMNNYRSLLRTETDNDFKVGIRTKITELERELKRRPNEQIA